MFGVAPVGVLLLGIAPGVFTPAAFAWFGKVGCPVPPTGIGVVVALVAVVVLAIPFDAYAPNAIP